MNKSAIFGVIGLIIGVVASGSVAAYAVNGNHTDLMKAYAMNTSKPAASPGTTSSTGAMNMNMSGNSMSMDSMTATLKGKTGDDFDKTFISEMMSHHQGAIDMASLALTNAKHQEVKDLAQNIVTAQTSEINEMRSWQTQWGYKTQSSANGSDMSNMGM